MKRLLNAVIPVRIFKCTECDVPNQCILITVKDAPLGCPMRCVYKGATIVAKWVEIKKDKP